MKLIGTKEFVCEICGHRESMAWFNRLIALTIKTEMDSVELDQAAICDHCLPRCDNGLIVNLVEIR